MEDHLVLARPCVLAFRAKRETNRLVLGGYHACEAASCLNPGLSLKLSIATSTDQLAALNHQINRFIGSRDALVAGFRLSLLVFGLLRQENEN